MYDHNLLDSPVEFAQKRTWFYDFCFCFWIRPLAGLFGQWLNYCGRIFSFWRCGCVCVVVYVVQMYNWYVGHHLVFHGTIFSQSEFCKDSFLSISIQNQWLYFLMVELLNCYLGNRSTLSLLLLILCITRIYFFRRFLKKWGRVTGFLLGSE